MKIFLLKLISFIICIIILSITLYFYGVAGAHSEYYRYQRFIMLGGVTLSATVFISFYQYYSGLEYDRDQALRKEISEARRQQRAEQNGE